MMSLVFLYIDKHSREDLKKFALVLAIAVDVGMLGSGAYATYLLLS